MSVWSLDFSRKMTNHLEIKNVLLWKFLEKSMPNRSSEWVLESSRRIEKLVEHSRINVFVLYLAYNIIVVSLLLWFIPKEYIITTVNFHEGIFGVISEF